MNLVIFFQINNDGFLELFLLMPLFIKAMALNSEHKQIPNVIEIKFV